MADHLPILEEAISDVGYWRWWTEALPDLFQVEFGGVQLHFPPPSPDQPPNSVVALRFYRPSVVAFLTSSKAVSIAPGWRIALHNDQLEPFSVDPERFTLTSELALQRVAADCDIEYILGSDLAHSPMTNKSFLAFRAQEVGLIVRAEDMKIITVVGESTAEQVHKAAGDWWTYWREYWRLRGSASPMPKDYACEVTIPIKS